MNRKRVIRGKNKKLLENELGELSEWVCQERESGTDFSDPDTLPWDKMKRVLRALEIEDKLKELSSLENKMKKSDQRNDLAKIKQGVIFAHSGMCDVCLIDNATILQIHHIVPIEKNGGNEYSNLSVLCPNCHAMIHKMADSFGREKESGLEAWVSENYSANAKERLLNLFLEYVKRY